MNTKKYFITLFSFIIFSIYFTLSGVFVPFIASIPQSNGGFKTLSSQNDFYKMVDNFYDPDEFYNFRTDNQNINILANFYNTLNASSNFDVLTSFNQAIAVDDFNGDQRFYYNSDEFIDNSQSPTINIKALQLNQKAYDFYNIEVEGNSEIAWNSISYKDNSIPVLLGSEYKSFYKIGDIITGNYYSKNTNFEVIGFIETDCSINYKNTSNITLDTYMLIPYPSTLWEVDKTNFQFESLLYFAMINCDLLPFVEESQILKNIKSISDETGFSDFSLVGIDNFQIQHIELLLFIQKHHILFIIGFLIIFILLNILCLYLFNHILKSICNQSKKKKKHKVGVNGWTVEDHLAYRQSYAPDILQDLLEKLEEISSRKDLLPKSTLAQAVGYALNEYNAICDIFKRGDTALDNNYIERIQRYISLSRRNSMFFGSHEGASRAAILYSIAISCRLNGINLFEYICDVIEKTAEWQPNTPLEKYRDLLPDRWKKQ